MYQLPSTAEISEKFPKRKLYELCAIRHAEQERMDADVKAIALVGNISSARLPGLAQSKAVIYVLQVELKRKAYDERNIALLQKNIKQRLIFALECGDEVQFGVYCTRLLTTEWMPKATAALEIKGASVDEVGRNMTAAIGGLDASSEVSLEDQVERRDARARLLREIETLERKCRAERQPKRKLRLYEELQKLKAQANP